MRAPKRAGLGHLESWGRRCGEDGQKNPAELEIKRLIGFVTHSCVWWYPPRFISVPPYERESLQCAATEGELSINQMSKVKVYLQLVERGRGRWREEVEGGDGGGRWRGEVEGGGGGTLIEKMCFSLCSPFYIMCNKFSANWGLQRSMDTTGKGLNPVHLAGDHLPSLKPRLSILDFVSEWRA